MILKPLELHLYELDSETWMFSSPAPNNSHQGELMVISGRLVLFRIIRVRDSHFGDSTKTKKKRMVAATTISGTVDS